MELLRPVGALTTLISFQEKANLSIDGTANEALELILVPENLDPTKTETYGLEVVAILKSRSKAFVQEMKVDAGVSDKEVDKTNQNVTESLATLLTKIDTSMLDFTKQRDTALTALDTAIVDQLAKIYNGLEESIKHLFDELDGHLTGMIDDMEKEFVKILNGVENEIVNNVDEALAPNNEVLYELNGNMQEAADDAAWAYDHPILSGIGSVLSFIGMLILGILAAIALIFVFFYAIAAGIALLVYLGVGLLVAQIIVYGSLLVMLGYNVVQAYNQRRAD